METVDVRLDESLAGSNLCQPSSNGSLDVPAEKPSISSSSKGKKALKKIKTAQSLPSLAKTKKSTKSASDLRSALRSRRNHKQDDMLSQEFSNLALDAKETKATSTGLSYDVRMVEHRCLWDPSYPECPERFSAPLKRCKDYGLIDRCTYIPSRSATMDELLLQHSAEVINRVKATSSCRDEEELEKLSSQYDAIYFHPSTYDNALLAVGSTIDLMTEIVKGKLKNGMGIIRPPGHHAMNNEPCGYCFFNNVAIAAKHAVENLGLKRVLIVDWDVHHGQASQYMFYNDPRVLYFSIHRYENGAFWPNLRESNYDFVGEGPGKGFNFNIPLNETGMGNSEYLSIFHQILLPVAYEFAPELVLVSSGYDAALGCFEFCPDLVFVSAGFDSATGDEKGCMEVTPACYSHLLHHLMGLANGKVCVILEGGYCIKSLSEGVALTLRTLLGDPCPLIETLTKPCQTLIDTLFDVLYVQRLYWKCLLFQGSYREGEIDEVQTKRHQPKIQFFGSHEKPTVYETRNCYPVQSKDEIRLLTEQLDALIVQTKLTFPSRRTCFVYDDLMMLHKNYGEPGHPEKPERIGNIFKTLEESDALKKCHRLKAMKATEADLLLAHTPKYLELMKGTRNTQPKLLNKLQNKFQSIYLCQESYNSALLAAGSLLQVLESVLTDEVQNGFAIIRPPGHHAETGKACGFCIFNNVAVAAKVAIEKYHLNRILIVDWDVHHGNGIQHMFESDPRVLYISLHRYDHGVFFPCSEDANFNCVGTGAGKGFNINIPWNKAGMGDGDYIAAFTQVVLPVAYQFNPELILVSAGFDAARGDPLGGCRVSAECYGQMTHLLCSLANGKVILALEGGYNLSAISQAMLHCTRSLLGETCTPLNRGVHPCPSAVVSMLSVLDVHKEFWSCLCFQVDLPIQMSSMSSLPSQNSSLVEPIDDDLLKLKNLQIGEPEPNKDEKKPDEPEAVASTSSGVASNNADSNLLSKLGFQDDVTGPQVVYAVEPLSWCPHLEFVNPLPASGIDVTTPCMGCSDKRENWLCLSCFEVYCGRFVNKDMLLHHDTTGHCVVMSYLDLSVWCYGCDAYVHNQILFPIKQAAHLQKFGEDMPAIPSVQH